MYAKVLDLNLRGYLIQTFGYLCLVCLLSTWQSCQACLTIPVSLDDMQFCENGICHFNTQAEIALPALEGSVSCFDFVDPSTNTIAKSFKVAVQRSYFTRTVDYSYFTDDPVVASKGFCGCPGGTTVVCPSCQNIAPGGNIVVCSSGIHNSGQCFLNAFGDSGTWCVKTGLTVTNRYKILHLRPEVGYTSVISVTDGNSTWTANYTGTVSYSTSAPFNMTIVTDTVKAVQHGDFIVYDTKSTHAFWYLSSDSVNGLNEFDTRRIGWVKGTTVSLNLGSEITAQVKDCNSNNFIVTYPWIVPSALLKSLMQRLSTYISPKSVLHDDQYTPVPAPNTMIPPDSSTLLPSYKGYSILDMETSVVHFFGIGADGGVVPPIGVVADYGSTWHILANVNGIPTSVMVGVGPDGLVLPIPVTATGNIIGKSFSACGVAITVSNAHYITTPIYSVLEPVRAIILVGVNPGSQVAAAFPVVYDSSANTYAVLSVSHKYKIIDPTTGRTMILGFDPTMCAYWMSNGNGVLSSYFRNYTFTCLTTTGIITQALPQYDRSAIVPVISGAVAWFQTPSGPCPAFWHMATSRWSGDLSLAGVYIYPRMNFVYMGWDIGGFKHLEAATPSPSSTQSYVQDPVENGVYTILIEFSNYTIRFVNTLIKPVISKSGATADGFWVSAYSTTVAGDCFASTMPPTIIPAQKITLDLKDTNYTYTSRTPDINANITFIITCYKVSAQTTIAVHWNLTVEAQPAGFSDITNANYIYDPKAWLSHPWSMTFPIITFVVVIIVVGVVGVLLVRFFRRRIPKRPKIKLN